MKRSRLWLDDVRPAPDGWAWARTISEAQEILNNDEVVECSLDHDLGLNLAVEAGVDVNDFDAILNYIESIPEDQPEETGMDLVDWMIDQQRVPPVVTIHSWNAARAREMARRFLDNGYTCTVRAYRP